MENLRGYIPSILICGNFNDFVQKNVGKTVAVLGRVEFDLPKKLKFFPVIGSEISKDPEIFTIETIKRFFDDGKIDYCVFTDTVERLNFIRRFNGLGLFNYQICTIEFFREHVSDGFSSPKLDFDLLATFGRLNLKNILDFDGNFGKCFVNLKPANLKTEIDGIIPEEKFPLCENLYNRIYNSPEECRFKNYSAVLFTKERTFEELKNILAQTNNFGAGILIFARMNSDAFKGLNSAKEEFENFSAVKISGGVLFVLGRKRKKDLKIYICAHKKFDPPKSLSPEYVTIHAGHKYAEKDLGFIPDDVGDNISRLNPYLNELTAFYHMWKNSTAEIIGLAHYRRYFLDLPIHSDPKNFSDDKILTGQRAFELLDKCDILLGEELQTYVTQLEYFYNDAGEEVTGKALNILKKSLAQNQPDYLEAFEKVISGYSFYKCNMFVTRKHVFDAYCKWLFSFILPAFQEFRSVVDVEKLPGSSRRIFGYFAERMWTVWLLKNRLKIFELPIFLRD